MSTLGPQRQKASYAGLLQVPGGITSTLQTVQDGNGNATGLQLSTTSVSALGIVSNTAQNIYGGSAGQLVYQTGVSTTNFVSTGTTGQFLQSNGLATPTFVSVTASTVGALPTTGGAMTGAIDMNANLINDLATPVASTDAATKGYVDSVAVGLQTKTAVTCATTTNLASLSGLLTIDSITVTAGQRVLVKDQYLSETNGIYVAAAGAWSRSTDADTWAELVGAAVFVSSGTANSGTTWVTNIPSSGTIGVTSIVWNQFSATGNYTAGTGLSLAGNQFSLSTPVAIANGGTNSTATPTAGTIAYGTGSAVAYSNVGSSGQLLQSNGSSAPTFATVNISTLGACAASVIASKSGIPYPNAISRPVSDMLGDLISIKDYGAIGDGTHPAEDTAAFQIAANSGTAVYIPAGSYILNSTITFSTPGTCLIGAGLNATFVQSTFASGDVFNITSGYISIENISFSTSVTRTSGSTVNMSGIGPSRSLRNFGISGAYIGVSLNGTLDELSNGSIRDTVSGSGMAIQVGNSASGFNQLIQNVITDAPFTTLSSTIDSSVTTIPLADASGFASSGVVTIEWEQISYSGKSGNNLTGATRGINGTTAASHNSGKSVFAAPLAGLRLYQTYDIRVISCELQHNIHGCYISPGNGQLAYAGYFDSCYFDSCSWAGLTIIPSGTGIANLCRFDACWFGNTATGDGIYMAGYNRVQGTHFSTCQVISNRRNGYVFSDCDDVSIIGGRVEGNGAHGINVFANSNKFNIVGVTSTVNGEQGVYIGTGCDYFNVTNCLIYDNTLGAIQDASGADHQNVSLNTYTGAANTRGVGCNVVDVTGSRNLSLNSGSFYAYANNRPYAVFVTIQISCDVSFSSIAFIGSTWLGGNRVSTIGKDYTGGFFATHSFMVPPNSSYYVSKSNNSVSVVTWIEYI